MPTVSGHVGSWRFHIKTRFLVLILFLVGWLVGCWLLLIIVVHVHTSEVQLVINPLSLTCPTQCSPSGCRSGRWPVPVVLHLAGFEPPAYSSMPGVFTTVPRLHKKKEILCVFIPMSLMPPFPLVQLFIFNIWAQAG